ncbi:AIF_collapsed_G0053100.mRNA.1.CDS.1 [Saccharomyces cerevisiae]|nr:AIF_collapsed_G0053100.mRNA.1.CDS.1 [Saccharomyces cerevisiae]
MKRQAEKAGEQVQKKTKKFNRASSLDDFISRTPSPSSSALNSSNTSNAWTTVSSKSTTHIASTMPVAGNQPKSYISLAHCVLLGGVI